MMGDPVLFIRRLIMYRFIKEKDPDNKFDKTNIEMEVLESDAPIYDVLEEFLNFLDACGFSTKEQRKELGIE